MKEFDKIIKQKLKDIESPYPTDTWANIKKGLPKKKRRPYGLYLFVFAFLSMSSLSLYKGFWKKTNSNLPQSSYPKPNENKAAVNLAANTSGLDEIVHAGKDLTDVSIQPKTEHLYSTSVNEIAALNEKLNSSSSNSKNTNNQFQKSGYVLNTNSFEQNSGLPIDTDYSSKSTASLNELNIIGSHSAIGASKDNKVSPRTSIEKLDNIILPTTGRVFGTDQSVFFESVQNSMKKNASLPCPTFVKKQNLSFIEFYFSNDYAIKSLFIKQGDQNAYLAKRNSTEYPFFSYSAGTRFGIGWESGIAFKSGFNYTQINEKFIYTDPNSIQKKTITILKYVYDNNFNVVDSIKTVEEVEIPGSNTTVSYNKFRFVDIPILFQYTLAGKKRLSYSLTFGPYINLSFTQHGKILSKDSKNLQDFSNSNLFKDNIGISLYTSLAINYQLTKSTQIVFEPNFRYMPNSIAQLQNPLDQKYLIASIAAGFRYKI